MMATRTLPFDSDISSSGVQLLADKQDALHNRDRRRGGEEIDRPLECAPRREDEPGGDDDDALGTRAEPDVAAQPERLCLRADVRHEERAGDRDDGEDRKSVV